MILDILENSERYLSLNKGFVKAFEFLNRSELNELAVGKYEINGEQVYAIVAKEQGRNKENAQLETHNQYIDIQFVLAVGEDMGWKSKSSCKQPAGEYNPQKDLQFFEDEPASFISVEPGTFAIFFPEDAHMPLLASEKTHKVIVKIAVNQS